MTVEDLERERAKLAEALTAFMQMMIIKIVFDKVDGEIREINATLRPDLRPHYDKKTERVKEKRTDQITVVDVDLGQWRNIKLANIRNFITPVIGNDIRDDPAA